MPIESDSVFTQGLVKRLRQRVYQLMMSATNFEVISARQRDSRGTNREVTISLDLNSDAQLIPVPINKRFEQRKIRYMAPELIDIIGPTVNIVPEVPGNLTAQEVLNALVGMGCGTVDTLRLTVRPDFEDTYFVRVVATPENPYAVGSHEFIVETAAQNFFLEGGTFIGDTIEHTGEIAIDPEGLNIRLFGYLFIKPAITGNRYTFTILPPHPMPTPNLYSINMLQENGQNGTDVLFGFTGDQIGLAVGGEGGGQFSLSTSGTPTPETQPVVNPLAIRTITFDVAVNVITVRTFDENDNILDLYGVSRSLYTLDRLAILSIGQTPDVFANSISIFEEPLPSEA